jgi:outer membrane receptor protein involved in Fe transport
MPIRKWDELRCVARGMLIVIGVATPSAHAADSASDESNSLTANLDEIVVTVQKRAERIRDVPIPVTALEASSSSGGSAFASNSRLPG